MPGPISSQPAGCCRKRKRKKENAKYGKLWKRIFDLVTTRTSRFFYAVVLFFLTPFSKLLQHCHVCWLQPSWERIIGTWQAFAAVQNVRLFRYDRFVHKSTATHTFLRRSGRPSATPTVLGLAMACLACKRGPTSKYKHGAYAVFHLKH